MFAVGHLALGYLAGRAAAARLKVSPNLSLLFLAAVIPDIDILIPGVAHRGPTHSLVIYVLALIPALLLQGKRVLPYFIALAQHAAIGDTITGRTQLLWPLTSTSYGTGMPITSPINLLLEGSLFIVSMVVLYKTKDLYQLFHHHRSNLLLSTPLFTVLLPPFLRFPIYVPLELIVPHLTYLALFTLSILMDLKAILFK
jgi:membrane-bound metal-dependent hydrolase YbcI (DUF457 family)